MVAPAIVLMLVAGDAIVKSNFARQSTFGEQFQGAIHRGETDAGIFLLYQPVQFVDGKVFASFKESPQDSVTLRGMLQTDTLQMLKQNLLSLAHHLGRDAGLIVNAFLQHRASAILAAF